MYRDELAEAIRRFLGKAIFPVLVENPRSR